MHISLQKINHLVWIRFLFRRWQVCVCVWLTVWHSSNWQESVELSHQKVLMQMVEKFYLLTVFKIKKNKPKDFLLSNLMKIIEHVMLFSYLGEKKKKWKEKEFFEIYVKIFHLRFLTISRIRVYLFFRLLHAL